MTNQLLLAQVLAAGFDWDYFWHWTHDQELGKVLISAIPPIATAAIAALSLNTDCSQGDQADGTL